MTQKYEKHQSFNNFIGKESGEIVKRQSERILPLLEEFLNEKKGDEYFRSIVHEAKESLSGKFPGKENESNVNETQKSKFQITQFIAEEVNKIYDKDVPRYIFHRFRYDVFSKENRVDKFPPYVQIEPVSYCNYKCVFCYQTDESYFKPGNENMGKMSYDLFCKIVDELAGNVDFISMASRGEPTLNKDLAKMLRYAEGKFLGLKVNTNASILKDDVIHAMLSGGVNTVVFSVDAADEELYKKLRVKGDLKKVMKNIEHFHEIKEKQYSKSRVITRVSGVKVSDDQSIEDMSKFWGDMVDQIAFVKYNPWENIYDLKPNQIQTPCSDLWRRLFIWFDGSTNPCDSDYKSHLATGALNDFSVSEIWRNGTYETLRKNHLDGHRQSIEPCKRCFVI
jgi:pyruvate-formate lyase-activating enzyme